MRGRALPSTRAAAALRRRAAAAGPPCALGRLSSASSAPCTPRCLCCRSPKTCPPRPPPTVSGVLLAAAGLAPGVESGQCRTRQTSVCGQSPEAAAPPPRGGVAAVAHSPGRPWGVTARAPAHGLVCVWCGQWASLLALDSGPRFWALGPCHMVISVVLGWTQTACRCAWEGPRAWHGGPWRSPLAWSPSALPAPGPGRPGAGGPGGAARPTWSSWRGPLRAWGFQGAESHLRCFCAVAAVPWLPSSSSGVNLPAGWLQRVWARCWRKERISV